MTWVSSCRDEEHGTVDGEVTPDWGWGVEGFGCSFGHSKEVRSFG